MLVMRDVFEQSLFNEYYNEISIYGAVHTSPVNRSEYIFYEHHHVNQMSGLNGDYYDRNPNNIY